MSDLPPPDVMDTSGRMKRLVIALGLGLAAAAAGYFISDSLAKPDTVQGEIQARGAYKFVGYITGLAGAAVFTIALVVQNHLAKQQWRASLVAQARTVKR